MPVERAPDLIDAPSAPWTVWRGPFGGWVVTCCGCGRHYAARMLSIALRNADNRHRSCQRPRQVAA